MKKLLLQVMIAMLPVAVFAQTDAVKAKEIQDQVVYLLTKTGNNFEGMVGTEVNKGETFIMYAATALPKMHAQNYYMTCVNSNKRNYYMAYYTDAQDMAFAKAAIMDMPKTGDKWTMGDVKSDNSVNTSYLYYNGARVGQLREDLKGKTFSFSLGLFDNTLNPPTKTAAVILSPAATRAKPINAAATETERLQATIADLVLKSHSNFESIKGTENSSSLYSTMYNTAAIPNLNAQAGYINYCKANGKSYYMAYYYAPKEDINTMIQALIDMPEYGGSKWVFEQVKKEDKYDDESMYCNLAYLYYDGVKVARLRKNERGTDIEQYFLLSIGQFDKTTIKRPRYDMITHPAESYQVSQRLTVANNIISVKGWGSKFDGEYDVAKLATDSCLSGNCKDGHGRKVLASITNNIPHIRIMEGKFKNNVFLGDGNMLIDGEGPVLDGTYELGNWKVSYTHNTLESKAVFHPKDYNESITGIFNGYLDDGIGKAIDTYQKFVVCTFRPDNGDKNISKWRTEIYAKDNDLGTGAFAYSKEYMAAYDKLKAAEKQPEYTNTSSSPAARTSGGQTQTLTIRRTCGSCGGTGRVYHNVTEYTYSGSSRIATSRRVSETCGACHGSGYL